jgi:hypothetical protein
MRSTPGYAGFREIRKEEVVRPIYLVRPLERNSDVRRELFEM